MLEIAARYRALGEGRLATRLENAAPCLFTFVMHPELHPANNEAERLLRPVAIQRLIRKHHVTEDGARAFSRIMTCALLAHAGPERLRRVPPVPIDDLTAYLHGKVRILILYAENLRCPVLDRHTTHSCPCQRTNWAS